MVRVVQKVPFPRPTSSSWLGRLVVGKGDVCVWRSGALRNFLYVMKMACLSPCKKEVRDSSEKRLYTLSNHKSLTEKMDDAHLK